MDVYSKINQIDLSFSCLLFNFAAQSTFIFKNMNNQKEQLDTLREIRSLMERSSRFLSLSGFSAVIAWIAAITGVFAAYLFLGLSLFEPAYYKFATEEKGVPNHAFYTFLLTDFGIVLIVSLLAASMLTVRKARRQGQPVWDATAKRLLVNMAIPLAAGGIYCLILFYHGQIAFIAPATLIFYGLALFNAGKYTLNDIRYLGVLEIITGLLASFAIEFGLLFWAFGFGFLHIIYGITMYFKYEK